MYVGSQSKWPHSQKCLKRLQYLLLVEVYFVDALEGRIQIPSNRHSTAFTAPKTLETGQGNAAQTPALVVWILCAF